MAKILCNYFGLSMAAEGKSDFVGRQAAAFLGYVQQDAERCAANCGSAEDLSAAPEEIKREILRNDEELRRREQTAPGVEHDVVAIYDNAGIPSIMHRFRRVTNKELFGGSDAVHPAFIIGGEVYDEIYISVYENTIINGKPYSLPLQEPVTNITMEDFAQACFSKGEGWHCLTAAEWGLLADTSLKLGTLPHGNTNCSHWHGDDKEQGIIIEDSYKTLTGSGPATWTHDHTASGVHDLCGNIWEFARGVRIRDGALWAAENNDAALPETDLTECGDGWKPITDAEGHPLYVAVEDNKITFNTYPSIHRDYCGCVWENVRMNCDSEQLRALALFAGEEKHPVHRRCGVLGAEIPRLHTKPGGNAGKQCRVAAHHRDYATGGVLARHTGAQGYAENEQVRKGHGSMLCVKKVIVICREVNSQTGQIAVYVVPMEIDEHTVVRLSLRSMFNPELRYFFAYEDVYQEQKQEITAMLKRRNITKQEVDSVYGIAEVGRQ